MLSLQIAVGIWMGGTALVATFFAAAWLAETIAKNKRYGAPWHRGIITQA